MDIFRFAAMAVFAAACTAAAQSDDEPEIKPASCIPIVRLSEDFVVAKGMPYSATRLSTCEETESDGTVVKGRRIRWEWRDFEGRTRREEPDAEPTSKIRHVLVTDPIEHVQWSWMVGPGADRTAIMWRYKTRGETVIYSDTYSSGKGATNDRSLFAHGLKSDGPGWKVVRLAPKYVNGVWAEGQRQIQVVPPGQGNNRTDRPQTVVNEWWFSIDLREEIVHHTDDPGLGKLTDDLVKIDRSQPDAALFQPPARYKVLESHPEARQTSSKDPEP